MKYLVGRKNLSFNKVDYYPGDIMETDEDRDWWVKYGYLTIIHTASTTSGPTEMIVSRSEEMALPESLLLDEEE